MTKSPLFAAVLMSLATPAFALPSSHSCAFNVRFSDNEVSVSRLGESIFRGSAMEGVAEMDRYVAETLCSVTPAEGAAPCDFELKQGKKGIVSLIAGGFYAYKGDLKTALHMMLKLRQLGACSVDEAALPECRFGINPFGKEAVLIHQGKRLLSSREGDTLARARTRLVEAGFCR